MFITLNVFSQIDTYRFKHITSLDGLSKSSVMAIHQDRFGQMWFGTRDGLSMYDGNRFTTYRHNPSDSLSISNNDIFSILEDSSGAIWVGTYNNLNRFDPITKTFKRFTKKTHALGYGFIRNIKEVNGNIWISNIHGISIYNATDDTFTNISHVPGDRKSLINETVRTFFESRNGTVWVGTNIGLYKLVPKSKNKFGFKRYYNENDTDNISVECIVEDKNSNLLIATKAHGLYKFDVETETLIELNKTKPFQELDLDIRSLCFDNDSNLWIGTTSGVSILTPDNVLKVITNETDDINQIKTVFKDKAGSLWLGTYYGGLYFWDKTNNNFSNYNNNQLGSKVISAMVSDSEGNLYFGTVDNGVAIFNNKTQSVEFINKFNTKGLLSNHVKSLYIKDNHLWIGTLRNGLTIYDLKTKRVSNKRIPIGLQNLLKKTSLYVIIEDNDNIMWLGTFGKGIIRYDQSDSTFINFKHKPNNIHSISSNNVRALLMDSKKRFWVGTGNGLNSFVFSESGKDDIKTDRFFHDPNDSKIDILTIFEDSDKTIWVGTKAEGLFKYNETSFEKVSLENGNDKITSIHSILEDSNKNLWFSTNQGIAKLNLQNNLLKVYSHTDGLLSNEFNDNSYLKLNSNRFYFGGPFGVSFFNPENILTNDYAPDVILTDFKIQNESVKINDKNGILEKSISYTKTIELPYDMANFSIDFSTPNFINNSKNQYSYRLVGLYDKWINTSSNQVFYTIQNPGNYIFEIKASNQDTKLNKNTTKLNIIVQPAPWRTWWAFVIYGLVIFSALFLLLWASKSREELRHKLELEHFEKVRNEEDNKAKLQFFTNISHEFRTPLTLIIGSIQQLIEDYKGTNIIYKKLLIIENNSSQLLKLINRLLDFRKLESNLMTLQASEGDIIKFLKEVFLSFSEYAISEGYAYNFNTSHETLLAYFDKAKLEQLFYNLISNAFRYTPKGGIIDIDVSEQENFLIVKVKDTGVGISEQYLHLIFERFFEVPIHNNNNKLQKSFNKGTGIGLSIVKNIIELHKGSIKVKNRKDKGAVFTVKLPLGKTHLLENEIIKGHEENDTLFHYKSQLNNNHSESDQSTDIIIPNEEKFTILIVEDDPSLRPFIKDFLNKQYNVVEAENGRIGMEMALKHLPDLIISDIVMPEMVGTELCKNIKENIKISHIPVILLTSRSSLDYKIEGFESGADDYISKPFNLKEFSLRVNNILESTKRIKQKFLSTNYFKPADITISSLDEHLLKKAFNIVEDNISNDQFNIAMFCSELGVSRTMLFTKIRAWTNFTPNEFIHEIRMKCATQLLEESNANISQIGYKVGFKDPKYFSKCFKKRYGKTPRQFQKKFSM
ncbi:two-component regulator propeller domain-containing protein [Tamlana sp. 2201CG12-4]|uniref:hybrid sensor histidine kinase/response regulator n=1 Tax=Tamlana sp. 2201CG12-4 TaxID=3112582 RepID=UPI002DBD8D1D|nr:two-component regulator propeller domain-containing protein [Tamlana sp. 2201CG12-4]MEC3907029.1 two-component regulator propeller domain-containing protein [Tamlana sp. 2201CG12-4]